MTAKLNAKKVIAKRDRNRVLKALSYVAAFPLFILFIFIGSISFMEGPAFEQTRYYGLLIGVALWLVASLIQIIALIVTKNSTARAALVIILVGAIFVGGSVYFDIWATQKVDEARIQYVKDAYGLEDDAEVNLADYSSIPLKNYKSQINNYVVWTDKSSLTDGFNSDVRDFLRVYNIGYTSSVKGSVNTDGSEYGATKQVVYDEEGNESPEYWFGETGDVYKENGLYADGYIFSMPVALEILITYNEIFDSYKKQHKDADEELQKALVAASQSTAWKNYKKSDEYTAAYGKDGTANRYKITEARFDKIVKALGQWVVEEKVWNLLSGVIDLVTPLKKAITEAGINENTFKGLDADKLTALLSSFGLEMDIIDLLEGFSNYEVSNVKPLMYFIKDETLRTYAYAKYFGEIHGGNIGSKLIPTKTTTTATTKVVENMSASEWSGKSTDDKKKYEYHVTLDNGTVDAVKVETTKTVTYGNIGCITMDNSGYNNAENAPSLKDMYLLRAELTYVPMLYPLFAARRYTYIFAGIIALMFAIFYYAEMKVKLIGKKLEKMSTLGGAR